MTKVLYNESSMTMVEDTKLQAKIEEAELEGWKIVDQKQHTAVMKKRSFGSLKKHIGIFIVTFYTLGIANILYAIYRFVRPKKLVLRGEPQEEMQREAFKQKQQQEKLQRETMRQKQNKKQKSGKTTREAMRTFRKFF